METKEHEFFSLVADNLMSKNPKIINQNEKLTVANELMSNSKINSLIVTDDNNILVGIVQVYDLGL